MFAWRYLDEAARELGTSERFGDRESAEDWMGASWSELRERGVEVVELIDVQDGRTLYRMPLSKPET